MLEIKNLSAGYDGFPVLHDISFRVNPQENLAIIGPNGCGKTTLLRCITNLISFSGEVNIDGKPVNKMKRREVARKMAMLSQVTQIYFSYSVFETVMMGRYTYRPVFSNPSKSDVEAVHTALETLHLSELKNREITTLSGGQLQRVFLAKILAQEPEIILLDEPTNHLDLTYQVELIEYLKSWSQTANHSVVGVLHDINLAMSFADNILLLKDGRIEAYGDAASALTSDILSKAYNMDIVSYMRNSLQKWSQIS